MRSTVFFLLLFTLAGGALGWDARERLREIDRYLQTDIDSAISLSKQLLDDAIEENDRYGMVKANHYLGYLNESRDYAKAVIYYLEGIRQAERADYEKVMNDRIWLRRNIANIFRRFKAYELASKYNLEAIRIAEEANNLRQVIDIKFNQGLVYQNEGKIDAAVQVYNELVPLLKEDVSYKSDVLNQIGLVYLENEQYKKAKTYFEQILNEPNIPKIIQRRALHNLGEVYFYLGDLQLTIETLRKAVKIPQENMEDSISHMYLYRNLGKYYSKLKEFTTARDYLISAEKIAESTALHSIKDNEAFKNSLPIYKYLSDVYYQLGDDEMGSKYSELYFQKMQEFMDMQEELQQREREYNLELIAKRYFDEVRDQERLSKLYFWFKISIIGIVLFFTLIIFYMKYRQHLTKKAIEQSLRQYQWID